MQTYLLEPDSVLLLSFCSDGEPFRVFNDMNRLLWHSCCRFATSVLGYQAQKATQNSGLAEDQREESTSQEIRTANDTS